MKIYKPEYANVPTNIANIYLKLTEMPTGNITLQAVNHLGEPILQGDILIINIFGFISTVRQVSNLIPLQKTLNGQVVIKSSEEYHEILREMYPNILKDKSYETLVEEMVEEDKNKIVDIKIKRGDL